MIIKENLIRVIKKEAAKTIKAMNAFPGDKLLFTPHDRSRNASRVMTTFVFEMYLIESLVFREKIDRSVFQTYSPPDLQTIISDFEKEVSHVVTTLEKMSEEDVSKEVEFVGKKMTGDEFAMGMIFDMIHHRGQLTVYIRLAGGKVPAIYGPSADDPTTGL